MKKWGGVLLMFFSALFFAETANSEPDATYQKEAKKVVIFSSTYCPNCMHVKKYLSEKDIPFMEFDIETSATARSYFEKLGGKGTPFLLVNNHPIQGFNKRAFWHYYQD